MRLSELLKTIDNVGKKNGLSEVFVCGGVCRDRVMGRNNDLNDVDLTTGDQGIHFLSKECYLVLRSPQTQLLNMPDGHARILLGDFKLDFSSNWKVPEIEDILKKMGKENPTEMEKEVFSRDFTCNALLMTMDMKVISDPTSRGINDIKAKKITTCLAPDITLGLDNKRVARIIYLAAKLNFTVDENILQWVRKHPETIKNCRPQYLAKKLTKAMKYNSEVTVKLLDTLQLWPFVPPIPELMPFMSGNIKRI